jgi:hypothetical protein
MMHFLVSSTIVGSIPNGHTRDEKQILVWLGGIFVI